MEGRRIVFLHGDRHGISFRPSEWFFNSIRYLQQDVEGLQSDIFAMLRIQGGLEEFPGAAGEKVF